MLGMKRSDMEMVNHSKIKLAREMFSENAMVIIPSEFFYLQN